MKHPSFQNLLQLFSIIFFIAIVQIQTAHAQKMDNEKLEEIFEIEVDSVRGVSGAWHFKKLDREMYCFTDEKNNRMRIISPISMVAELDDELVYEALVANFHSALDVKYAISDDIMWSIFVHPLKELSDDQVLDAIRQVFFAAETFGTTYTSTDLVFPGGTEKENDKKEKVAPTKKM